MLRKFLFAAMAVSLLMLSSCSKDDPMLIEGTWEWVNVEDIEDIYTYEWVFKDGELTFRKRSKNNIYYTEITGHGRYLLDTSPFKTTLRLMDSPQLNDRWEVAKLTKDELIIQIKITGGVLYKEFVKKDY